MKNAKKIIFLGIFAYYSCSPTSSSIEMLKKLASNISEYILGSLSPFSHKLITPLLTPIALASSTCPKFFSSFNSFRLFLFI